MLNKWVMSPANLNRFMASSLTRKSPFRFGFRCFFPALPFLVGFRFPSAEQKCYRTFNPNNVSIFYPVCPTLIIDFSPRSLKIAKKTHYILRPIFLPLTVILPLTTYRKKGWYGSASHTQVFGFGPQISHIVFSFGLFFLDVDTVQFDNILSLKFETSCLILHAGE